MSAKSLLTATNVAFLLAAVYFAAVAAFGEGSLYSAVGTVLCLIAVGLDIRKDLVVGSAWRLATAAFSFVVFAGQLVANATSPSSLNAYSVASTLINGVFLVVFVGVVLNTSRVMMKKPEKEEEEEEKTTKKLTYEV